MERFYDVRDIVQANLVAVVAGILIVTVLLSCLLFSGLILFPQWRIRTELASEVATVEAQVMASREAQMAVPTELEAELVALEAEFGQTTDIFLSSSQAAEVLDNLYQYAVESGVTITALEAAEAPAQAAGGVYEVQRFVVQASGPVPRLMDFVTRIREAALPSVMLTDMMIAEGEGDGSLSMNLWLYTSPLASGEAIAELPDGVVVTPTSSITATATLTATVVATTDVPTLVKMLDAAWLAEDWPLAIGLIEQILALDPTYPSMRQKLYTAHANYGYALVGEGRPLEAQAHLELGLHGVWTAGNWPAAIDILETILAVDPGDAEMREKLYAAHVNHGALLQARGQLAEARSEYERALLVKPDGGEAILALEALTAPPPPPPDGGPTVYVVQRGDTLFSLARRFGTTVEALRAANGLPDNTIVVGEALVIPGTS